MISNSRSADEFPISDKAMTPSIHQGHLVMRSTVTAGASASRTGRPSGLALSHSVPSAPGPADLPSRSPCQRPWASFARPPLGLPQERSAAPSARARPTTKSESAARSGLRLRRPAPRCAMQGCRDAGMHRTRFSAARYLLRLSPFRGPYPVPASPRNRSARGFPRPFAALRAAASRRVHADAGTGSYGPTAIDAGGDTQGKLESDYGARTHERLQIEKMTPLGRDGLNTRRKSHVHEHPIAQDAGART